MTEPAVPTERGEDPGAAGDLQKIIGGHPFLKGLSPHQCRLLQDCAMLKNFKAGELIFREGDPANRFYLILRGKVVLESHSEVRGRIPIQTLEDGDVLGWSWLFPPYFWHFEARAVADTDAVFFYATPLRDECEADHDLGYELIKRMSQIMLKRLQATRRQLVELASGPPPSL